MYGVGQYDWENLITAKYSEYDLFIHVLGFKFDLGKPFNSPLREDKNPSFCVFVNKNGGLMFKDFATGESGSWLKLAIRKYGLTKKEVIHKIFKELFIDNKPTGLSNEIVLTYVHKKKNASIGLKLSPMRDIDVSYWKDFGISEKTLKKYNVVSVSHIWVNDTLIRTRQNGELIFAYLIDGKIKIYSPKEIKAKKWYGNTDHTCIYGQDVLPKKDDLLIITKALKDVMVLYELGYNAICPNSEGLMMDDIIEELKPRFSKIITLFDNDTVGINTAKKYKEKYNLDFILIPIESDTKDISDYYRKYGRDKSLELIKTLIDD